MSTVVVSRPTVHGSARFTSRSAGVGKASSDGPMSPRTRRLQKLKNCSSSGSSVPYSSVSAARIASCASGLKPDCRVRRPMVCSTGSSGDRWVMKKVALTPRNTTISNWPNRFSTK